MLLFLIVIVFCQVMALRDFGGKHFISTTFFFLSPKGMSSYMSIASLMVLVAKYFSVQCCMLVAIKGVTWIFN